MRRIVLVGVLGLFLTASYISHSGGLDRYGCHRDNRAGGYHCLSGALSGRSFGSLAAMLQELTARAQPSTAAPIAPTPPAPPAARSTTPSVANVVSNDDGLRPFDPDLYGTDWQDVDGDCQDTRTEALIAQTIDAVILTSDNCRILTGGRWYDPLSGKVFKDVRNVEVHSFIPLGEVHRSGGETWSRARREAFANDLDPRALIIVDPETARSRGDKDPSQWLPEGVSYRCVYIATWRQIKRKWNLSADDAENGAVERVLQECAEAAK